jgi:hypothetical protein
MKAKGDRLADDGTHSLDANGKTVSPAAAPRDMQPAYLFFRDIPGPP